MIEGGVECSVIIFLVLVAKLLLKDQAIQYCRKILLVSLLGGGYRKFLLLGPDLKWSKPQDFLSREGALPHGLCSGQYYANNKEKFYYT